MSTSNPDEPAFLRHRQAPDDPFVDEVRLPLRSRRSGPPAQSRGVWLRRVFLTFGGLILLLAIGLVITGAVLRHDLQANLLTKENLLDGRMAVAGLSAAVTVKRDAQNVPSIHAANLDDLLFAQGYVTASDRLFQMDALRRHGAGTLAEILGPSLIQHDREQRILQLRAAADRAAAQLPPDQLRQLQAYARGVNSYITAHNGSNGRDTLPIEFHILHYSPELWQPRDSLLIAVVMAQDLATDFPTKLDREALSANLPSSLVPDLYPVGSWRDQPPTQESPNLSTPSAPIVQIPLDRTQSRLDLPADPAIGVHAATEELLRISADLSNHRCGGCRAGSNNWVVAGNHTASGAPLLSNDMHLGLTAPDIWYEAALHVDAPGGLNVEGFTLPGVPFVIVGRNAFVAWGFTNSGADVQDVLIEHLRSNGSVTEYERPDHSWAQVLHHTEVIHVRAGRDVTLDVLTAPTSIGNSTIEAPMITPLFPSERRALALAWTIYDPSTLTSPFLSINSATDGASLVAAFASFGSVSQNLVYADAHHIGYHLLGRIPIRGPATQHAVATRASIPANATPLSLTPSQDEQDESGNTEPSSTQPLKLEPTPGPPARAAAPSAAAQEYTIGSPISPVPIDALDASQAWSGYIPYSQLPAVLDPTSGIIATANARITPPNYPYAITLNWADPYRVERIHHLLEADIASGHSLTAASMLRIQTDVHSEYDLLVAQRLAYALDHSVLAKKDARLAQAANILRTWTGDVSINSAAAEITDATEHELWPMLLAPQVLAYDDARFHIKLNDQQLDRILNLYAWGERRSALEQLLQNTPARWLPPKSANWDDFLAVAVQRGLRLIDAPSNLGRLQYGADHPIDIGHPIFGSHSPISTLLGVATGSGRHAHSGDPSTVKAIGTRFGPSERFTADLGDPDHTYANITTGESGNPASPHFLDQFQPWLQGTTLPLPLSHPTTEHTLTLTPQ